MNAIRLKAVMSYNDLVIERIRALNLRAGTELFRTTLPQAINRELVYLGGFRNIIHEEAVSLLEISQFVVDIIETENPEEIIISGREFPVVYAKTVLGYHALLLVDEVLVYSTKVEKVFLPSGRQLVICCGEESAMNFSALRRKLAFQEANEIWSARCEMYETEPINNIAANAYLFPRLGLKLVVDNGAVKRYGYVALSVVEKTAGVKFHFFIAPTRRIAKEETEKALLMLLEVELRKEVANCAVDFWGDDWKQMKFSMLFGKLSRGLNPFNFAQRVLAAHFQLVAEADQVLAWLEAQAKKEVAEAQS